MRSLYRLGVPILLTLALIVVAGVSFLGRTQAHADAAGTSIALYHNFGRPFSSFTVSGNGYGQSESVTITFDSTVVGTATAVQTKFSQPVNVPGTATPGNHTVTATGQTTGATASAVFLVQTWWVMFGFDAQNTHNNPDENVVNSTNASQLMTRWTYQTKDNPITPIVRKDNTYFAMHNGTVTVLRPKGSVMWSKSIAPVTISSIAPAVYYGIVYVGADDGNLYAFNYNTGALMWTLPTGGPILSSTVIAAGTAYFGSNDDKVYAIGAESTTTPKIKWSFATTGPVSATPVVVPGGNVIAASQDGNVYEISKTGTLVWQYNTGSSITSSPAVSKGLVYVGSSNGTLYAINTSNGQLAWSVNTGSAISSSPAVDSANVYIGSGNSLYAYNATTGAPKWNAATGGAVNSSPSVGNGVVYVGSEDNSIYAFDTKLGSKLWSFPTGGKIDTSPSISDGVVLVGSADGNIYTFHLPGTTP